MTAGIAAIANAYIAESNPWPSAIRPSEGTAIRSEITKTTISVSSHQQSWWDEIVTGREHAIRRCAPPV